MKGKKIIVGVSGGIAAYKAAELVRLLVKADARTFVTMTSNGARFVTPLTFEALSGTRVIRDMWDNEGTSIDHISWGQESDLIIIAPATANFIAKMAHGIGDDFLSTMVLAATAGILVCPSMNSQMFKNPAVQDNLRGLKARGMTVMEPGEGQLACHTPTVCARFLRRECRPSQDIPIRHAGVAWGATTRLHSPGCSVF